MTALEAIDRLIEAVEAGADLGFRFWFEADEAIPNYDHRGLCDAAYHGDLNAALLLKGEIVPFWAIERMSFWPGKECYFLLLGTHEGDDGGRWHHHSDGRVEATDPIPPAHGCSRSFAPTATRSPQEVNDGFWKRFRMASD